MCAPLFVLINTDPYKSEQNTTKTETAVVFDSINHNPNFNNSQNTDRATTKISETTKTPVIVSDCFALTKIAHRYIVR